MINVRSHVARNTSGERSVIDRRTTRHPGNAKSQRISKRIAGCPRSTEAAPFLPPLTISRTPPSPMGTLTKKGHGPPPPLPASKVCNESTPAAQSGVREGPESARCRLSRQRRRRSVSDLRPVASLSLDVATARVDPRLPPDSVITNTASGFAAIARLLRWLPSGIVDE